VEKGKAENMKCRTITMLLLTILLLPVSCGYHFTGEGAGPRPGLRAVAIPVFENNTSEPDLGSIFAGALRKEFITKGHLQVVPLEQAEAIFRGRMTRIYSSAVAHREAEATIQTRLYVTMEIRCVAVRDGAVIWQDPSFTYYQTFIQAVDPNLSFSNRRTALEYLAQQMSIRIHDRFLSNF
jgi:hypothetical protein